MKKYQAIRITKNGAPTYGDKYTEIYGDYKYKDIVTCGNDKYIILFEVED